MKALDYDKLEAMDGIEYDNEEIDTFEALEKHVIDAVPIPKGATNGDLIKTLFPSAKWWVNEDNEVFTDSPWKPQKIVAFDLDWWNALYKRRVEI